MNEVASLASSNLLPVSFTVVSEDRRRRRDETSTIGLYFRYHRRNSIHLERRLNGDDTTSHQKGKG